MNDDKIYEMALEMLNPIDTNHSIITETSCNSARIDDELDWYKQCVKQYTSESEWKSKYRSQFLSTFDKMVKVAENFTKTNKLENAIEYPGCETWDKSEMPGLIKYMDNFRGGPNDRASDGMSKSLVVCIVDDSKMPLFTKKKLKTKLKELLNNEIPDQFKSTNHDCNLDFIILGDSKIVLTAGFIYFDYVEKELKKSGIDPKSLKMK